ncbi:MAG: energy-coupling factor ABC transporter permease [Anaerolineae bacterium]
MHIPDGFVNTGTSVVTWVASAGGLSYAVRRVNKELGERQVPLMGVSAAFIFAAQMLNFTVAGGTSGHLLGGALAAILLGPWAGMLVMTSVLAVQALLFQDGGLLALGPNVFNMAVVGVLVGWLTYEGLRRLLGSRTWGQMAAGFAAGWLSVVVASIVASVELALSGTSPFGVVLPAMGVVSELIGIGEGLITVAVLAFLRAARPDLLEMQQAASQV